MRRAARGSWRLPRPFGQWWASSVQVEPVQVHHLGPGGGEVVDELLFAVVTAVHLGQSPELGVGAEHQVGRGGGVAKFAGGAVAALVDAGLVD